jgi:hypothetical protein
VKQLDERAKKSGVLDLFADQAAPVAGEERSSPEEVDAFWRLHLSHGEKRVDTAAFADILESTNWLPKELQASLTRLINSGEVINLDAVGSRRPVKPLHFDKAGERLQLTITMSSSAVRG